MISRFIFEAISGKNETAVMRMNSFTSGRSFTTSAITITYIDRVV